MLISVMVVFNGGLSEKTGHLSALVFIHLSGLALIVPVMILKKQRFRPGRLPLWKYSGGLVGILTTVFNNIAFGQISVSALLALALLGESVSGLAADHFGLLGMPVRRFHPRRLPGIALALAGIALMLNDFKPLPVLVSLLAGGTVLLSRLINGSLARATDVRSSTLINYLVGLLGALALLTLSGGGAWQVPVRSIPAHIFLGGALGAVIILFSNFIMGRIPVFSMSLAFFTGQVFTGVLLDAALTASLPWRELGGGLFVLAGLVSNLLLEKSMGRRRSPDAAVPSPALFPLENPGRETLP